MPDGQGRNNLQDRPWTHARYDPCSLRRASDQLRRMSFPGHLRVARNRIRSRAGGVVAKADEAKKKVEEIKEDLGDKWNEVTGQKP